LLVFITIKFYKHQYTMNTNQKIVLMLVVVAILLLMRNSPTINTTQSTVFPLVDPTTQEVLEKTDIVDVVQN